nr:alpha/beta hydrolase [Lentilactobacillus kosonis]
MFSKFRFNSFRTLYFIIGIIIIILTALSLWHSRPQELKKPDTRFVSDNTPTLFIHGWSSSLLAERDMVTSAEVRGVAKKRMIINVRSNGKIVVDGTIKNGCAIQLLCSNSTIIALVRFNMLTGLPKYANY